MLLNINKKKETEKVKQDIFLGLFYFINAYFYFFYLFFLSYIN